VLKSILRPRGGDEAREASDVKIGGAGTTWCCCCVLCISLD